MSFHPEFYWYKAEMVRIIDGDTIVVDLDKGFGDWSKDVHVRLFGIDAPEMRGDSREAGEAAKQRITELLPPKGGMVAIKSEKDKTDSWDRVLADVYTMNGIHINQILLAEGFAESWSRSA